MNQELTLFNELASQVAEFVAPVKSVAVTDNVSASAAVDTGKVVKEYRKKIEDLRKELVGPLNDRVKEINAYAKEISAPLDEAEGILKKALAKFADEQEKKRQEELRKLEEAREAERKRIEAEAAEAKKSAPEIAQAGIAVMKEAEFRATSNAIRRQEKAIEATAIKNTRKTWKAEVMDPTLVPREYLTVDTTKINAAVKAGIREIPGVRIYQETSIAFGRSTSVPTAALANDYFGGANE